MTGEPQRVYVENRIKPSCGCWLMLLLIFGTVPFLLFVGWLTYGG